MKRQLPAFRVFFITKQHSLTKQSFNRVDNADTHDAPSMGEHGYCNLKILIYLYILFISTGCPMPSMFLNYHDLHNYTVGTGHVL